MEGKEFSAFSRVETDTAPHALPGQQAAGRLAHAGPHGMHARRNGPCMHESVQAQPHAHFTDHMHACMHMHTLGHVGSWLAQSYVRVRCTQAQLKVAYVRIPSKRSVPLSHCVIVARYVPYINCTCMQLQQEGRKMVGETYQTLYIERDRYGHVR